MDSHGGPLAISGKMVELRCRPVATPGRGAIAHGERKGLILVAAAGADVRAAALLSVTLGR